MAPPNAAATSAYVGQKLSLISKCNIRYSGVLESVDGTNFTLTLRDVKSFGTEDRKALKFIPESSEIISSIEFDAGNIVDLYEVEIPTNNWFNDPVIVKLDKSQQKSNNNNQEKLSPPNTKNMFNKGARFQKPNNKNVGNKNNYTNFKKVIDLSATKEIESKEKVENEKPSYEKLNFFDELNPSTEINKKNKKKSNRPNYATFGYDLNYNNDQRSRNYNYRYKRHNYNAKHKNPKSVIINSESNSTKPVANLNGNDDPKKIQNGSTTQKSLTINVE
ncbi:MAG: Protein LSM14 A [Paramarteilia canceri]